jgi:hypothetical protein
VQESGCSGMKHSDAGPIFSGRLQARRGGRHEKPEVAFCRVSKLRPMKNFKASCSPKDRSAEMKAEHKQIPNLSAPRLVRQKEANLRDELLERPPFTGTWASIAQIQRERVVSEKEG